MGPTCPRCARLCRTGDRFCALCGANLVAHGNEDDIGTRRAERKLVSIVFIDMVGFTSLGHHHDAETVKTAMTEFFQRLAQVARAHGGYVEKFIGDAMMTVFGAPVSREDDAIRALNAAIEVHRALDEVNARWSERFKRSIQIRVGVNTGIAIAGAIGEGRATDYGVSGDVVNVASRLESSADPGQTIVGELTRELGGRGFLYESIPPLTLKGKPEPVPAFRVLGRAEAVTELFETVPILGRKAVLEELSLADSALQMGSPSTVNIRSEPGLGKSRLLDAYVRRPELADAALVRASSGGDPLSIVRTIAGSRRSSVREAEGDPIAGEALAWLREGDLPDPGSPLAQLDPATRAEILGATLADLIRHSAQPIVVAIDNVERSDQPSLDVIARVLRAEDVPILLATTSDTPWDSPWANAVDVTLTPLDDETMDAVLVSAIGTEEIDAGTRASLIRAASGSPLALGEIVWSFRQTGVVPRPHAGGLAASTIALIQARIDAADEEAREVLRAGSVLGTSFDARVAAEMLGRTDVDPQLSRLARRNLVVGHGARARFARNAIRDVVYESLLQTERRQLHGRAAATLSRAGVDDPFKLAEHLRRGDDDDEAIAALVRSAQARATLGDLSAALTDFRESLARFRGRETSGVHSRAAIEGRVADLLALRGQQDEALAIFRSAVAGLPSGLSRAELLRRAALVAARAGQADRAYEDLQSARDDITLAELDGNEAVEAIFAALAAAAAAAAGLQLADGRSEEASWEARQALEMLSHLNLEQAAAPGPRRAAASANLVLAEALLVGGQVELASEAADAARAAFGELGDLPAALRSDILIARTRAAMGQRAEARARIESALALGRRLDDRGAIVDATQALGELGVVVL